MKAIFYNKYGSSKNLKLKEIQKPIPKDNEVLVKVYASSINSWDWDLLVGKPYIYRLIFGLFKPKNKIIGIDIAGKVELVGSKVKHLKVSDEVFGDISETGFGAFAEYAITTENFLAKKPVNATFEEAATLPHGGLLALQGLQFNGSIKKGQKVLINGAGGSTGPFALQMAKLEGAEVTCVDKPEKFEVLRKLGADHLIDYTKEDYTKQNKTYDLIIDLIAHKSVFNYKRALAANGSFTIVGGSVRSTLQIAIIGGIISKFSNKKMGILLHKPNTIALETLKAMFEEGKLKSIIDKNYALQDLPEAIQYYGDGHSVGKVVITIDHNG